MFSIKLQHLKEQHENNVAKKMKYWKPINNRALVSQQ